MYMSLGKCPPCRTVYSARQLDSMALRATGRSLLPFVELISVNYGSLMSCPGLGARWPNEWPGMVDSFVDHLLHATKQP